MSCRMYNSSTGSCFSSVSQACIGCSSHRASAWTIRYVMWKWIFNSSAAAVRPGMRARYHNIAHPGPVGMPVSSIRPQREAARYMYLSVSKLTPNTNMPTVCHRVNPTAATYNKEAVQPCAAQPCLAMRSPHRGHHHHQPTKSAPVSAAFIPTIDRVQPAGRPPRLASPRPLLPPPPLSKPACCRPRCPRCRVRDRAKASPPQKGEARSSSNNLEERVPGAILSGLSCLAAGGVGWKRVDAKVNGIVCLLACM